VDIVLVLLVAVLIFRPIGNNYYTKAEQVPFFSEFWIIFVPMCHADTCSVVLHGSFVCISGDVLQFLFSFTLCGFYIVYTSGWT
jgi:ABC-type cobalamin transport system permease subunit